MASLRWRFSVFMSRWRNRARYLFRAPRVYKNWWVLPLPKLGVSVVLKLRNGLQYLVRAGTTDLAVVNETSLLDPYVAVDLDTLPEDATIMDVGANIGDFTMKIAHARPRGRIYAVEPVSEHIRMIKVQQLLNQTGNLTILHLALGGREGEIDIHVAGGHSSAGWGTGPVEKVRLTTLPRIMAELQIESLALLKLDCEGAEWEIIPAAEEVLPKVQRIVMEFHCANGWTPEKLADWLRERGYEVHHTTGSWNGLLWAKRTDLSPRTLRDTESP